MYFLGIDMGSGYAKAAVCEGGELRSYAILPSGGNYQSTSRKVAEIALEKVGKGFGDAVVTVATGYGSAAVDFANDSVTDILCHAIGIHHIFPSVRTAIDIGAQFSKAIRITEDGRVASFVMNEKCAGGSGKFLQVIARILHRSITEIAETPATMTQAVEFTTGCAVFAESEAVSRIAEGALPDEILAGVHKAMASKIANLVTRVGLVQDCSLTGGGAKHVGLVRAVEGELAVSVMVPTEPQITAALGASLVAWKSIL